MKTPTFVLAEHAALQAFRDAGCLSDSHIDQADHDMAACEYIRHFARCNDIGAIAEFLVEHPDDRMLKIGTLLAEGIRERTDETAKALGEYLIACVGDYLAPVTERVARQLPSSEDINDMNIRPRIGEEEAA